MSIGQRVLASQDLIVASAVRVPFATLGTVVGPSSLPDRITVCFDTVTEGQNRLDVQAFEILPSTELIGRSVAHDKKLRNNVVTSLPEVDSKWGSVCRRWKTSC